ncbi:hypothetical protein WA026_002526 [Henosepilachna vigintioctopunctata]|uniref:Uncharacterized protein n=1 Tax=Henosepilachna vigintioctopunctata TaxID=420089 RepID=A0AAW1TTQ8_9CUCU
MVCGKEFRSSLRKPLSEVPKSAGKRIVPAFSVQSRQNGTRVAPPPSCYALQARPPPENLFRYRYFRGDFPIALETKGISWKTDISKLDFHFYLPMFFEGLTETEHPTRQLLPVLNMFKNCNVNCGDEIDYTQTRGENVSDLINETLELMERTGGEDAFINIKYLVPTYESCLLN